MTKTKRTWIVLLLIAVLVTAGILGWPKLERIYRDISFSWQEHTEAELRIKA